MITSVNETIDLRLQSRADQENRGNDDHVADGPGAQPCQDKFIREPEIEAEKGKGDDPSCHDTHQKQKENFPFQLRVHGFLLEGRGPTLTTLIHLSFADAARTSSAP